eukprot:gnl/MRDRNA2_/MRDRNA2_33345_c0_seq1.p1 gnl/MRDRNA2_/MRDRNA2_33345_c0~~gnl/MRDRNA2_/MRDRNA2_33345_c0_seq1.p1  ORF type:complete len:194 (+),score=39.48 gnl/MRDRNA2_/MRDRNA2_33345_c0_seq1:3-584(+)
MTPRNHHASMTPRGQNDARNLPVERRLSEGTITGTVKVWSRRAHGFITSTTEMHWPSYYPAGCDIYVAHADLMEIGNLKVGKAVEFRVYQCNGGKTKVGAAEIKEIQERGTVQESNLRVVPFWEWPLTQEAKKMRVMSLYQHENSDLQDDLEKCEEDADKKFKKMQRKLEKAQARIDELESMLNQGSSSQRRR